MGAFEVQEAIPDIEEEVWRLQDDARALRVAAPAVEALVEAAQSVAAVVDAEKGIGSLAAVYEAAVSATQLANEAVDGIHEDTELFDDQQEDQSERSIVPHIEAFWKAVALDVEWLESGKMPRNRLVIGSQV